MLIFDLYCGAGGASWGIHEAFPEAHIVGFDINPQKHYPFEFCRIDVTTLPLEFFEVADFIWASPPCQAYSRATWVHRNERDIEYPDLMVFTRDLLQATGKPWVMENVELSPMQDAITLCGQQFGLRILRHRLFEASFPITAPPHKSHVGLVRGVKADFISCVDGAHKPYSPGEDKKAWQEAMGIDWMTKKEMSQAVPPAYARFLMGQWMQQQMGLTAA